jgi:hypothetical protein
VGRKEITIEGCDVPTLDLTFDVEYRYYYRPAVMSGPPDQCSEEESESSIEPIGVESVIEGYLSALRPLISKAIMSKCMDMEIDGYPKKWTEDDRQSAADDKAESIYEERRLRA